MAVLEFLTTFNMQPSISVFRYAPPMATGPVPTTQSQTCSDCPTPSELSPPRQRLLTEVDYRATDDSIVAGF